MRKILLALSIFGATGLATANYTIKVPLESDQGGALPKGSIIITPMSQPEEWLPTTPTYTDWTNDGEPFNCTNWNPDPNTVAIGQSFTQTATDCKQDQTRTRQDREQETTTLDYRNVGSPIEENQTLTNQTNTRNAIGTMESWVSTNPIYTAWINSGGIYGCTNWSPLENTVGLGTNFEQTATDCKQDQTRTRQDREQETSTLEIRNVGTPVTENRTLTSQPNTRTATGTKVTLTCKYDLAGSPGYIWFVDNNVSQQDSLWWNLTNLNNTIRAPRNSTTYTYSGTTYQRGVLKLTNSGGKYYEICKVN